jgi:hypothetical protein
MESMSKTRTGLIAAGAFTFLMLGPITGQVRAPTAAELAALATPQPPQSSESVLKQRPPPPVQTRLPDGTIMYDMRNQPQIEEQACVLADGRIGACPAQKRAAP